MQTYVVAHPDDEILWLMPEPGDRIVVCTRPTRDPARVEQFKNACAILDVQGEVSEYYDERTDGSLTKLALHSGVVVDADTIVTHNAIGEYGHPQHQFVNQAVMHFAPERTIQFGYGMNAPNSRTLTDRQFTRKVAALQCYRTPVRKNWPSWQACVDLYFGGNIQNLRRETWFGKVLSI